MRWIDIRSAALVAAQLGPVGLDDHALIPAHIEQASDVTGSLVDCREERLGRCRVIARIRIIVTPKEHYIP